MAGGRNDAERFDDSAGDAVHEIDGPAESGEKPLEGTSDHEGDAFGAGEADGFGNEFAEDDVDGAEEHEGEREGDGVNEERAVGAGFRRKKILNEFGERGFAESAEGQAGEGDAELDSGDDAMEIAEKAFDDAGLGIAFGDELAHARHAHGDERELRGGEEAVENHEQHDSDQAEQKHGVAGSLVGIVAGGKRAWARDQRPVTRKMKMPD